MKYFSNRFLPVVFLALLAACHRGGERILETAYVSGVQAILRDRVAAVYEKAGVVKNGERVEVLDRDRHFDKVRTATGVTGWVEQRFLVSQEVYDQIQKLTADNQKDPVQAQGTTRNDTNLHVEPGRETEHLYQISTGEKLSLLKRGTADKAAPPPPHAPALPVNNNGTDKNKARDHDNRNDAGRVTNPVATSPGSASSDSVSRDSAGRASGGFGSSGSSENSASATGKSASVGPPPVIEDWWLVRDSHQRVGWVLGRMIDLDVPLDIAEYAEGQRIVAFFVLDQVADGDKKVPQYLTVLTEPKDGLPFDFNQVRVFTWNARRHRYENAYRERMEGLLPVTVSQENFDKEGTLPVFVVRARDDRGDIVEKKYKLNTPIVRRVLAPGEQAVKTPVRKSEGKKKGRRKR